MAEITEKRFPRIVFTNSQDNSEISGGGSSDFSIAKVTITLSFTVNPFPFAACSIYEEEDEAFLDAVHEISNSEELNVPLYKGIALFYANSNPDEWGTIVCTGGVEYDSGEGAIVITGDGTITATESGGED